MALPLIKLVWIFFFPIFWVRKVVAFKKADPVYRVEVLRRFRKKLLLFWYIVPLAYIFLWGLNWLRIIQVDTFLKSVVVFGIYFNIPFFGGVVLFGAFFIFGLILIYRKYLDKITDFFEILLVKFWEVSFEEKRELTKSFIKNVRYNHKILVVLLILIFFSYGVSELVRDGNLRIVFPLPFLISTNDDFRYLPALGSWIVGNWLCSRFAMRWMLVIDFANHLQQAMIAITNPMMPAIQPKAEFAKNGLSRIIGEIVPGQWHVPTIKVTEPGRAVMNVQGFPIPLEYFFTRQAELEASMNCRFIGVWHEIEPSIIFFVYSYNFQYLMSNYSYEQVPKIEDQRRFYLGRAGVQWIEWSWDENPHTAIGGKTRRGKTKLINHLVVSSLNGHSIVVLCDATGGIDWTTLKYRPDKYEKLKNELATGEIDQESYCDRRKEIDPIPCTILARDLNEIVMAINWAHGEMQRRTLRQQENDTSNMRQFEDAERFGNSVRIYPSIHLFFDEAASAVALGKLDNGKGQHIDLAKRQIREMIRAGAKHDIHISMAAQRPSYENFGPERGNFTPLAVYIEKESEREMHFDKRFPMPDIPGVVAMSWKGGIIFVKVPLIENEQVAEFAWEKTMHLAREHWPDLSADDKLTVDLWLSGLAALERPPDSFAPELVVETVEA
jgi:hypothetical protein